MTKQFQKVEALLVRLSYKIWNITSASHE